MLRAPGPPHRAADSPAQAMLQEPEVARVETSAILPHQHSLVGRTRTKEDAVSRGSGGTPANERRKGATHDPYSTPAVENPAAPHLAAHTEGELSLPANEAPERSRPLTSAAQMPELDQPAGRAETDLEAVVVKRIMACKKECGSCKNEIKGPKLNRRV